MAKAKKQVRKKRVKFKLGDTVVFDPLLLNPEHWDELCESDRVRYYGHLGYGNNHLKLFTFICEMSPQGGHCVLVELGRGEGKLHTMCHTSNFRLATDDEC